MYRYLFVFCLKTLAWFHIVKKIIVNKINSRTISSNNNYNAFNTTDTK